MQKETLAGIFQFNPHRKIVTFDGKVWSILKDCVRKMYPLQPIHNVCTRSLVSGDSLKTQKSGVFEMHGRVHLSKGGQLAIITQKNKCVSCTKS